MPRLPTSAGREVLKNTRVKIATVIAFPFGATFTEIKAAEMRAAAAQGADEADFVVNISLLKSGNNAFVETEMQYLADVARKLGVVTKFIENGFEEVHKDHPLPEKPEAKKP